METGESQEDRIMDMVRAVQAVIGGPSGPAAALDVQPDTRAVISQIAASEGITESQRSALVAVAVDIDAYINAQPLRAGALDQVAGLGVYLNQTSTNTVPRWTVLTALRTYGLNQAGSTPAVSSEATAQQADQQATASLESVARSARSVSLDTALATVAARAAPHVAVRAVSVQAVATPAKPVVFPKADGGRVEHVDAVV